MKRLMSMVVALAFLLSVAPSYAATTPVTEIPAPKQFSSVKLDLAANLSAVIDGTPVSATGIAARGVLTTTGSHIAYYLVATNTVVEEIIIGNDIYVRTGNDTRWKTAKLDTVTPIADTDQIPASAISAFRLDDTSVRNVPAAQYQLQVDVSKLPANSGLKAYNLNLFLALSDNALLKDQVTQVATDPDLGDLTLQIPVEYSAFNDPSNVVNRPPADLVDAAQIDLDFPGAKALKPWARFMVSQQIQELRAR